MNTHWLYRIRPTRPEMLTEGPTDDERQATQEHFAYLKGLSERGVVLLAGRTTAPIDESFGIVVFAAADDRAAQALVDGDPAVARGVMSAELFPYRVAIFSPAIVDAVS